MGCINPTACGEATARFLSAQGAIVVLGARRVDRLQSLAGGPTVALMS